MLWLLLKVFIIVMFIVWALFGTKGVRLVFGNMRTRRNRWKEKFYNLYERNDRGL